MKKSILLSLSAIILLAGCTSKEQSQQIRLFWLQQYANLMMKKAKNNQQKLAADPRLKELVTALQKINTQPNLTDTPQQNRPVERPAQPQIMDVTMDTDPLPGKASQADRTRMKRALEAVQLSNQRTLNDIAVTFGEQVKYKAFLITTQTERQLKKIAAQSPDFASYWEKQQKILNDQNTQINKLMQQNTNRIKKIK